jgi:hypothetical protein
LLAVVVLVEVHLVVAVLEDIEALWLVSLLAAELQLKLEQR